MSVCVTIDCDYLFPRYAAAFLLVEGRRAAFIENNTTHSVPKLMQALAEQGLQPADVEYVVITHVHLDHAGGSSALMKRCPNATLLAHPRAVRHIVDPTKLIAGAKAVYGEARFAALYGEIEPVAADRVRAMADGEALAWGSRQWEFFHTRGHANHHFCLWDSSLRATFTGDSFGVAYPDLQTAGRFIFPTTSPTDFNADEALKSIARVASLPGDRAFLTHFGEVRGLKECAAQLSDWIIASEQWRQQAATRPEAERRAFLESEIAARLRRELAARGLNSPAHWDLLKLDLELNVAGLAHAASRDKP